MSSYLKRVAVSFRVIVRRALAGASWLDLLVSLVAVVAVLATVFDADHRSYLGHWLGWWRAIAMSLGLAVLVNIRAISNMTKISVACVVIGLATDAPAVAFPVETFKMSYIMLLIGVTLWMIGMLIRPSLLERLNEANNRINAMQERLNELERQENTIEKRLRNNGNKTR